MLTLFECESLLFLYDPARDLVIMRRTSVPMPEPNELPSLFTRMLQSVKAYEGKPLLIDLRAGRGNNHPEFERAIETQNERLARAFPVYVLLVRTAVGMLQVSRLTKSSNDRSRHICNDEATALAKLEASRR